jgi:hypothetical protein
VSDDDGIFGPQRESGSEEDERLWSELAAVIADADPVPAEVLQGGRDSFAWTTIDAELAELAYDSAAAATAVGRAADSPRLLTFEAPGLLIEVEVTVTGPRRRLIGQLVPPRQAQVTVRHHKGGTVEVEADDLGRFRAEDLPAGFSSLRCNLAGTEEDAVVVTDWITL